MSSVAPPSASVSVSLPGSSGPVTATVVSGQAALAGLPAGTTIQATLSARMSNGMIAAMTSQGPVVLKVTPGALPSLPAGTSLAVLLSAVQTSGSAASGGQQVTVVGINGRSLGGSSGGVPVGGAPQSPESPQSPSSAGSASLSRQAPVTSPSGGGLSSNGGLIATVMRPGSQIPAQAGALAGLPSAMTPGTQITVRIASIQPPPLSTSSSPMLSPPPASSAAPAMPAAPAGMGGSGAAPSPLPSPPSAASAVSAAATTLTGTVLSSPPGGNTLVQTPAGVLSLPVRSDAAAGSVIQLQVLGAPQPPASSPGAGSVPLSGGGAAGMPIIQAAQILESARDLAAMARLGQLIPQDNAALLSSMALITKTLRRGPDEVARALEPVLRGLEKAGRGDVAQRMKADFDGLAKEARRPVSSSEPGRPASANEWRALTMPFLANGAIEPVRLYVRGGSNQDETDPDGSGKAAAEAEETRFIVDLSLSRLGRMQLDGLVRGSNKLFDLIIRTGQPLPENMRMGILGIFNNASAVTGTKGTVVFQSAGRWVDFPPDPAHLPGIIA